MAAIDSAIPGGAEVLADGDRARNDFLERFSAARDSLAKRFTRPAIAHVDIISIANPTNRCGACSVRRSVRPERQ
ncbi:MAG: hypothetical protein R3F08_04145 [Dokdonella sp.]